MKKCLPLLVLAVVLGAVGPVSAGPVIIRDELLRDTAITPALGRGYSIDRAYAPDFACGPNEFLDYQSGGLGCVSLPGGGVSLPSSSEPTRYTAKPELQVTNVAATLETQVKVTSSAGMDAPPSSIGAYMGIVVRDTNAPGLTPQSGVIVDLQTNAIRLLVRQPGGDWTVCGMVMTDMSTIERIVRLTRDADLAMVYLDDMLVLECNAPPPGFSPASAQPTQMEFGINGGTAAGATFLYAGLANDGAFSPGQFPFLFVPCVPPHVSFHFAGNGTNGYSGDGGPAANARINAWHVAVGPGDVVYIADSFSFRIRRVDPVTGIITTIAGDGVNNNSGDGGQATNAQVRLPYGICVDAAGNIYFAAQHRIRKITAASGIISTVAGVSAGGFGGDGGLATAANLNTPKGVAVDAAGNIFICDQINQRIRRVDAVSGIITTIAGDGAQGYNGDGIQATNASLRNPEGISLDAAGNVFIADRDNNRIRRVDAATGLISTVAGTGTAGFLGDGGPATSARISAPYSVLIDPLGNLFVGDASNRRIRRVDAGGIITTYAGNGSGGDAPDAVPALSATMVRPYGLAMDSRGNLFYTDFEYGRVRFITPLAAPHCNFNFANQLAGYWPFNETTGQTAADVSMHANHGALNNFPVNDSQWVAGKVGGALNFRGAAAQDFVRVASYPKASNTVSVSAWVWADALTPWGTIAKNWGNTLGGQFHFGQWDADGDLSAVVQQPDGAQPFTREGAGAALPTGSWQHVVFVADGAHLRLYRNGTPVGAPVPYTGGLTNPPPNGALGIGAKLDDAGLVPAATNPGFWEGRIDELALWTRPLSACEISALYAAGNAGLGILDPAVRDVTPPALACPADITVPSAPGQCSRNITFSVNASDACNLACVTCTPASGSAFPIGTTTVNCIAVDDCGNTNTCSFTVTVTDASALLLVCPAPQTNATACLAPVPDFTGEVVVTRSCSGAVVSGATVTQSPPPGTLLNNGVHIVTLTASSAGQTGTCATAFHVVSDPPCLVMRATFLKKMVLWLPLDESAGPAARNLVAGAPSGTHGGSPIPMPGENVLGALSFDGVDDSVTVPHFRAMEVGSFALDAWVRRGSGDTGRRVLMSKVAAGPSGFECYLDNGVLKMDFFIGGVTHTFTSGATVPADGNWHHVAALYHHPSNGRVALYIDGVRYLTPTALATRPPHNSAPLVIGASAFPTPNSHFKGGIDEAAFYSADFSEGDPAQLVAAGRSGRCRIECRLPWDQYFHTTNAGTTFTIPVVFVNNRATPTMMNWAASGPMSFLPPSSGVVTVPAFGSVTQRLVFLPPTQTNPHYFVTVTPEGGCPLVCEGAAWYTAGIIPTVPQFVVNVPGSNGTTIPITLSNVPTCRTLTLQPITPDMTPATNGISLNGQAPGPITIQTPCPGGFRPAGGGEERTNFTFNLNVQFPEADLNALYTILVLLDIYGDSSPETLASIDVQNTVVPPSTLRVVTVGNQRQLHWDDEGDGLGTLESAPAVIGPWDPVMDGAPGYVLPATPAQQFYRVRVP